MELSDLKIGDNFTVTLTGKVICLFHQSQRIGVRFDGNSQISTLHLLTNVERLDTRDPDPAIGDILSLIDTKYEIVGFFEKFWIVRNTSGGQNPAMFDPGVSFKSPWVRTPKNG